MKKKRSGDTVILSPCQIVAWNLEAARRGRGWTQEETARRLEPYLGYRMTRAALSQAERCLHRGRIRRFDADEIVAFARAFDLPALWFLSPPEPQLRGKPVFVNGKPGNPRAHVTSPPLTRNEMMRLAATALMPAADASGQETTDAATQDKIAQVFTAVVQRTLRDHLKEHPEDLTIIASGKLPPEFLESLTSGEEEKAVNKVIGIRQRIPEGKK